MPPWTDVTRGDPSHGRKGPGTDVAHRQRRGSSWFSLALRKSRSTWNSPHRPWGFLAVVAEKNIKREAATSSPRPVRAVPGIPVLPSRLQPEPAAASSLTVGDIRCAQDRSAVRWLPTYPRLRMTSPVVLKVILMDNTSQRLNLLNGLPQSVEELRDEAKAIRGELLPPHPTGESEESLEKLRVELLTDIKKRNNKEAVRMKMEKTFSYRRLEVVRETPMVQDFQKRWPALFDVFEINAEFKRITTLPLQSRFLSQLDILSSKLLALYKRRGGQIGKRLQSIMDRMTEEDVDLGRESVLKGLCVYLNEDVENLLKEHVAVSDADFEEAVEETTVGIFTVKKHEAQPRPDDIGIVLEGEIVIQELDNVPLAVCLLFGLLYALNMDYPRELSAASLRRSLFFTALGKAFIWFGHIELAGRAALGQYKERVREEKRRREGEEGEMGQNKERVRKEKRERVRRQQRERWETYKERVREEKRVRKEKRRREGEEAKERGGRHKERVRKDKGGQRGESGDIRRV
ncbi:hypothetical protein WMY93_029300 [Mugilogobius chulae]|uniref:Uncharacterized protein n=1 Tax=Mugilogobius chulae TaxID=88201 RepID=A0AAW0MWU2_9GOBI